MTNPPAPSTADLPRKPSSFWTGKVTADVSVGALGGSSTLQGDLDISILPEGLPLPAALTQASAESSSGGTSAGPPPPPPPTLPTVFGTLTATFSARWSNDGASAQGSGTMYYGVGGTYDPNAHAVSLTLATTGIQLTGTLTRQDGTTQSLALSTGGSLGPLGTPDIPGSSPAPLPQVGGDDGQLSFCLPAATSNQQPITLNLQVSGGQAITQNSQGDDSYHASRTVHWSYTLDPHQITVDISPNQLDPTQDPSATLTVTVTSNGQPSKMETVNLEICTYIGGTSDDDIHAPDGHTHDSRGDMCDRTSRPTGQLQDTEGLAGPPGQTYGAKDYPLKATTGMDGKVTMTYTPPCDPTNSALYFAAKEQIKACLLTAPNTKNSTDITTKVDLLQPASGSQDGSGGGTFYFSGQSNHGEFDDDTGLYYGTDSTNQTLVQIANDFYNAQIACRNGASAQDVLPANYPHNGYTTDPATNTPRTFTTPGEPMRLRITAMSLPWGGLLDITGNWKHPHSSHSTGRVADLGWQDFALAGVTNTAPGGSTRAWNMDLVYLLGAIVTSTPGATLSVSYEGGDLSTTLEWFSGNLTIGGQKGSPENAHFHVQFAS